jgi:hypothetical protein
MTAMKTERKASDGDSAFLRHLEEFHLTDEEWITLEKLSRHLAGVRH